MSKPRGTLKYRVDGTSRRFASVVSKAPGAGLPPSMYSVPPCARIMLKLWFAPNVWLHGNQSTITGGRSARNGQPATIAAWFAHSMRWVFTTPFGVPVEPDVNRIFAIVSGVTLANARSTATVGATGRGSNG